MTCCYILVGWELAFQNLFDKRRSHFSATFQHATEGKKRYVTHVLYICPTPWPLQDLLHTGWWTLTCMTQVSFWNNNTHTISHNWKRLKFPSDTPEFILLLLFSVDLILISHSQSLHNDPEVNFLFFHYVMVCYNMNIWCKLNETMLPSILLHLHRPGWWNKVETYPSILIQPERYLRVEYVQGPHHLTYRKWSYQFQLRRKKTLYMCDDKSELKWKWIRDFLLVCILVSGTIDDMFENIYLVRYYFELIHKLDVFLW